MRLELQMTLIFDEVEVHRGDRERDLKLRGRLEKILLLALLMEM